MNKNIKNVLLKLGFQPYSEEQLGYGGLGFRCGNSLNISVDECHIVEWFHASIDNCGVNRFKIKTIEDAKNILLLVNKDLAYKLIGFNNKVNSLANDTNQLAQKILDNQNKV